MEFRRLGVESELQLLAYATVTAMPDLSTVCDIHHSSRQHWILNPLRWARDQICILMDTSRVHYCCVTMKGQYPGQSCGIFSPGTNSQSLRERLLTRAAVGEPESPRAEVIGVPSLGWHQLSFTQKSEQPSST